MPSPPPTHGEGDSDRDEALALAQHASETLGLPVLWPPLRAPPDATPNATFAPPPRGEHGSEVAEACRRDERRAVEEAARAAAWAAFRRRPRSDAGQACVTIDQVEVVQLRGGVTNQTFRATITTDGAESVSSGGDCIASSHSSLVVRLRGAGDGLAPAMREYVKEAWCAACAAEAGLPTPRPVGQGLIACHQEVRDRIYAFYVQELVEGIVAQDAVREGLVTEAELWRQMGAFAGGTHSIPVAGFGNEVVIPSRAGSTTAESEQKENDALTPQPLLEELTPILFTADSFTQYINRNLRELGKGAEGDPLQERGYISSSRADLSIRLFTDLKRRSEAGEFQTGLCHGDLSMRNVLVDNPARVVGVIDWGCAEAAIVPHASLVMLLEWSMYGCPPDAICAEAFALAAGVSHSVLGDVMQDVRTMLLLRAMAKTHLAVKHSTNEIDCAVEHLQACFELIERRDEVVAGLVS